MRKTGKLPLKYHGSTTEVSNEVRRLVLVMDNELKRSEIQEKLGLRNGAYFRKNYLMPSIEMGIVEMTIPETPKSSKQRYRLSDKGKALKSEIEQRNNKK